MRVRRSLDRRCCYVLLLTAARSRTADSFPVASIRCSRLGSRDDASIVVAASASDPNGGWTTGGDGEWSSSSSSFGNNGEEEDDDDSRWTSFRSAEDEEDASASLADRAASLDDDDDGGAERFLDVVASLAADEIDFVTREAERADNARRMQEWGFDGAAIEAALGLAATEKDDDESLERFREGAYGSDADVDPETVESHATVEWDDAADEPVRSQMVYVDEHNCIGCYNCANTAGATFFMESEHGRARVFSQWGDDDETVQTAIDTCPVNCIHYVSYEELVRLEIERRGQSINNKARLVNQGEYGGDYQHVSGGSFTAPQRISGNAAARCTNCPSRGCANCPMYGVGKNPVFEERERRRVERAERRRVEQERRNTVKSAEL